MTHEKFEDEDDSDVEWLSIDTIPDPEIVYVRVVAIWWEDDFHLVISRGEKWVLYHEQDYCPFDAEEKPVGWFPLPRIPLESIRKLLEKKFGHGQQ